MKSKTVWEYSKETEALRLLHAAHQISVGFYRVNNFIVLPYNPKINTLNLVTFPDLNYNNIPRFWDKVKSIDIVDLPIKVDKKLLKDTINLMSSINIPKAEFEVVKEKWAKAEVEILTKLYDIIPSKKDLIRKITIYPTVFGTGTSFNWGDKSGEILMYLRTDQGVADITEAIITSLTRRDIYKNLDGIWQESEIITDWLVSQSSISDVIKKYDKTPFLPTIKGVRIKQQARLLQESDNFYKKLGFPINQKIFGLNGLTPEINKKPLMNLSETEKAILKLLIEKAGGVASFDEIGAELFEAEDAFSLYAISKTIERLRNKLEANGISGSYIQTLRGKGYLLKN